MWTHHQLLKLPFALHHQISRISGKTRHSAKLTQGEDSENRLIYEWPSVFKTWLIVLFVLYLFSCKGHLIHSLGRSRFTEQSQLPTTHFPTANFMNMSTFILRKRHSGEDWYLHHDRGAPSDCFGGRDQALSPAGVLGVKFLHGGCPLVDKRGNT